MIRCLADSLSCLDIQYNAMPKIRINCGTSENLQLEIAQNVCHPFSVFKLLLKKLNVEKSMKSHQTRVVGQSQEIRRNTARRLSVSSRIGFQAVFLLLITIDIQGWCNMRLKIKKGNACIYIMKFHYVLSCIWLYFNDSEYISIVCLTFILSPAFESISEICIMQAGHPVANTSQPVSTIYFRLRSPMRVEIS